MDTKKFITAIRCLHAKQAVIIRFTETGLPGLKRLNALVVTNEKVTIDTKAKVLMLAVLQSTDWDGSDNRNYIVNGITNADDEWLAQVARDVEDLTLVDHHEAKGLMTSREKMRKEAFNALLDKLNDSAFYKEINSWDCIVDAKLRELEGLPIATFNIIYDGKHTIASVSIDGWSGRIIDNGVWTDTLYVEPAQIHKLLLKSMESFFERLTRAA